MRLLLKCLAILWSSPNSVVGFGIGMTSCCFGGRARQIQGCLEFHGGAVEWLLQRIRPGVGISAMTLGHTILGRTQGSLDRCRKHEHVHVRQYEKWGPFFIPAYFISSLLVWWRGGDPYFDNRFEVEAYAVSDPRTEQ